MKYTDLNQMNDQQLRKELNELREKAVTLAQKKKLGQVKNIHELAGVRKDIARILTYLRAN
jgi:ribosomal protein L29